MTLPRKRCRLDYATQPDAEAATIRSPLTIYKTYPSMRRAWNPERYLERLGGVEPEIVFRPERLHTPGEWTRTVMPDGSVLNGAGKRTDRSRAGPNLRAFARQGVARIPSWQAGLQIS